VRIHYRTYEFNKPRHIHETYYHELKDKILKGEEIDIAPMNKPSKEFKGTLTAIKIGLITIGLGFILSQYEEDLGIVAGIAILFTLFAGIRLMNLGYFSYIIVYRKRIRYFKKLKRRINDSSSYYDFKCP
tara:strand:- start:166 stop:555 length:390 start_codon:yes stop_codon:yes gene_type:complete